MTDILEPQESFPKSSWVEYARTLAAEVERLRSLNESLMENSNDLRERCQKAEARIKEMEAVGYKEEQ